MPRLLVVALALLSRPATWQPFALDQRISVVLPFPPHRVPARALPTAMRAKPVAVWQLVTLTGTYQLTRAVNPAKFFPAHDTLGHAAYFAKYQHALRGLGAHHITSRPVQVAGLAGREFSYYTAAATPSYLRCFLLDSVGYAFAFQPTPYLSLLNTLAGAKQRRRFFNSITVKP